LPTHQIKQQNNQKIPKMTQNEAQSERGFRLHLRIRSSKTIAKQSKNQAKSKQGFRLSLRNAIAKK
jgi:hypothetical protein